MIYLPYKIITKELDKPNKEVKKVRLKLYFTLENNQFPIQYHRNIMSFIKLSLTEYNQNYYEKLYHAKDNIIKPYAFATLFSSEKFEQDTITLKEKRFEILFTIAEPEIAVALYNSFNHQKGKKFPIHHNAWTLQNISMISEKQISETSLQIKFLSPLVARSRENRKDFYYSFEHQEFLDTLKINIKEQLKITNISPELVDSLSIQPIQAKKIIIKFYEKKIETSIGTFQITADKELLKYLYQAGIGSKRSSGFGVFEIK